eukprot:1193713-Prorocentrum_minimum.AAC.4
MTGHFVVLIGSRHGGSGRELLLIEIDARVISNRPARVAVGCGCSLRLWGFCMIGTGGRKGSGLTSVLIPDTAMKRPKRGLRDAVVTPVQVEDSTRPQRGMKRRCNWAGGPSDSSGVAPLTRSGSANITRHINSSEIGRLPGTARLFALWMEQLPTEILSRSLPTWSPTPRRSETARGSLRFQRSARTYSRGPCDTPLAHAYLAIVLLNDSCSTAFNIERALRSLAPPGVGSFQTRHSQVEVASPLEFAAKHLQEVQMGHPATPGKGGEDRIWGEAQCLKV